MGVLFGHLVSALGGPIGADVSAEGRVLAMEVVPRRSTLVSTATKCFVYNADTLIVKAITADIALSLGQCSWIFLEL